MHTSWAIWSVRKISLSTQTSYSDADLLMFSIRSDVQTAEIYSSKALLTPNPMDLIADANRWNEAIGKGLLDFQGVKKRNNLTTGTAGAFRQSGVCSNFLCGWTWIQWFPSQFVFYASGYKAELWPVATMTAQIRNHSHLVHSFEIICRLLRRLCPLQ